MDKQLRLLIKNKKINLCNDELKELDELFAANQDIKDLVIFALTNDTQKGESGLKGEKIIPGLEVKAGVFKDDSEESSVFSIQNIGPFSLDKIKVS